jgi:hypothetical protein
MGDNERADLADRLIRLEVKFEEHEKGAVIRKQDSDKKLDSIISKQDGQQCIMHSARMIEMDGRLVEQSGRLGEHSKRIDYLERVLYIATGGLTVIVFALNFFNK